MVDPQCHPHLDKIFDDYRKNDVQAFQAGMNTLQKYIFPLEGADIYEGPAEAMIPTVAIHSFISGLFFAAMTEHSDPAVRKILFDDWFEQVARARGEHIIDFKMARINKK